MRLFYNGQSQSRVVRCFALLSLHELGRPLKGKPLLRHIRTNNYLKFTIYRSEMKQALQSIESAGHVYKDDWYYGVSDAGKSYLRESSEDLSEELLTEAGKRGLKVFAQEYDEQNPSQVTSSRGPADNAEPGSTRQTVFSLW